MAADILNFIEIQVGRFLVYMLIYDCKVRLRKHYVTDSFTNIKSYISNSDLSATVLALGITMA